MNSDYERFTGRLKADYQLRDWFKLSGNMSYTHSNSNYLGNDGSSTDSGNLFAVNNVAPIYPIYVRDGNGNIIINQSTGLSYFTTMETVTSSAFHVLFIHRPTRSATYSLTPTISKVTPSTLSELLKSAFEGLQVHIDKQRNA